MPRFFEAQSDGSLHLTPRAMELPLEELREVLRESGHDISRTTAWRARKSGVCWPTYHEGGARVAGDHLGWVGLRERERQLGPSALARRFGISIDTARRAIERGWFSITKSNQGKVTVAQGRVSTSPPPADRPPVDPIVPEVIREAPDGRPVSSLHPREIADIFGVSPSKAAAIRRRGELRTRSWPAARKRALAERLANPEGSVDSESNPV